VPVEAILNAEAVEAFDVQPVQSQRIESAAQSKKQKKGSKKKKATVEPSTLAKAEDTILDQPEPIKKSKTTREPKTKAIKK